MTSRRWPPWPAILLLADGLTTAIGGKQVFRQLHRVAPPMLQVALDGVLELPESWLRLTGAGEALVGGIILAAWLLHAPGSREDAPAQGRPAATSGA